MFALVFAFSLSFCGRFGVKDFGGAFSDVVVGIFSFDVCGVHF